LPLCRPSNPSFACLLLALVVSRCRNEGRVWWLVSGWLRQKM
jgi:hypothetical protein